MTDKTSQSTPEQSAKGPAVTGTPAYAAARTVDFSEIPVIDLAAMNTPEGEAKVAETLVKTASEIGFFYVSGHGIPPTLSARAMAASRGTRGTRAGTSYPRSRSPSTRSRWRGRC